MMNPFYTLAAASFLAFIYVGSLYVWRSDHERDNPITIRRRFLSAFCTVCVSPFVVYAFASKDALERNSIFHVVGIRTEGLLNAIVIPLALTVVLFMGPIAVNMFRDNRSISQLQPWSDTLQDLIFWRNHVVAPFTEEFTFR